MIQRMLYDSISESLFRGRTVVVYGAHRTGKTTLLQMLQEKHSNSLYLDCAQQQVQRLLENSTEQDLRERIGDHTMLLIDEGQHVKNIGSTLKRLSDGFPRVQVVATGSLMLFDLANDQNLMLVAGKTRFYLTPLAVGEIPDPEQWTLEKALIYGMYPEVVVSKDPARTLRRMAGRRLYADIFAHEIIRGKGNIQRLLQVLALHVGQEVSYNELGAQLDLDKVTVARYVKLLEQMNILFRLMPYKRRLRKELNRLRKIYFYDLGVRNALIKNFNPLHLRMDAEALWENYFICEMVKRSRINQRFTTPFYWRTYDGTGLDFLEEEGEHINAYKCSLRPKKWRKPSSFIRAYPNSELHMVTRENYRTFL